MKEQIKNCSFFITSIGDIVGIPVNLSRGITGVTDEKCCLLSFSCIFGIICIQNIFKKHCC